MAYNTKFRKLLLEKIVSLSRTEHEEIYKIINRENVSVSSNRNGIFFNLSNLSDELIDEIDKFVTFCHYNKKDLDDYDKKINECKVNNVINILDRTESDIIIDNNIDAEKSEWDELVNSIPKKSQIKLQSFITNVQQDREKISKKSNNGFNNARKRFGKKIFVEFPRSIEEVELNMEVI